MIKGNKDIDAARLEKLAEILKTISHPVRLEILRMLEANEPLTVTQINEGIPIEQSLLSHHLSKMKDRGLLYSERSGKNVQYSLVSRHLLEIFNCLETCDLI